MRLLLIRHAPAEDRAAFARSGRPDCERPLTEQGRDKMRANARGLRELVAGLDVLATSPYTRAAETAAILADAFEGSVPTPLELLAPDGARDQLLRWLRRHGGPRTIAMVGHEPWLSETLAWLLTGSPNPLCEFKKGGACLLEFRGPAGPGGGVLHWLLSPAVLRKIAKGAACTKSDK